MPPSYGFLSVSLNLHINTIQLQGNTYIRQLDGEDNYGSGSGTMHPPEVFFLGLLKFSDQFDIAGQHIHPTAGRGGDSRYAGGLQAGQRGQHPSAGGGSILKGLSHEIDFKNLDQNLQNLA
jgi:hypothetical protein